VSLPHIAGFDAKFVFVGEKKLPVGRRYKSNLLKELLSLGRKQNNSSSQFDGDVNSLLKQIESQG
jgi:hypothetical protein